MDKDISYPAAKSCKHFFAGDINDYDDVIEFGKNVDIITIEIEGVNLKALFALEKMGEASVSSTYSTPNHKRQRITKTILQ